MPSLKAIRKRISSVKSTQKITRAMKMVAGARLARAQSRIVAMRPYAVKAEEVLAAVVADTPAGEGALHPLLVQRGDARVLYLVLSGDRGLSGSFNANVNKATERLWRKATDEGKTTSLYVVGRKGRDYLKRRNAPVDHVFSNVWEKIDIAQARAITHTILAPFRKGEVDAIYVVYNEFKSAMTQELRVHRLLPVADAPVEDNEHEHQHKQDAHGDSVEYIFEPDRRALLDRLVPMYLEVTVLRALLESQASELGARMTAMDAATKNAKEMIGRLTLSYNRARQAGITKELMEIVGGAEAIKE